MAYSYILSYQYLSIFQQYIIHNGLITATWKPDEGMDEPLKNHHLASVASSSDSLSEKTKFCTSQDFKTCI